MSSATTFVLTVFIIVGGLSCGYLLRRLGIVQEKRAPAITLVMLLSTYPLIAFLAIWPTPLERKFSFLPIIQALSFTIILLVSLALSGVFRLGRGDRGTFVFSCALTNQGYTMGGLICYLFYGVTGLALAQIYVTLWNPLIVLVVFPLAHHFGPNSVPGKQSIGRLIFKGHWHVRSFCSIGLIAGIAFSLFQVPYPAWIAAYSLPRILVFVGTFGAFAVIGLSLHLGQIRKYVSLYFGQAIVKFMAAPLLALVMIAVFGLKLDELPAKVVLTQGFMPTAVNSVLIANLFGLNSRLASAMFVVNTAIFLLIILPVLAFFTF